MSTCINFFLWQFFHLCTGCTRRSEAVSQNLKNDFSFYHVPKIDIMLILLVFPNCLNNVKEKLNIAGILTHIKAKIILRAV